MMFYPFRSESQLYPDNEKKCENLYITNIEKIDTVKAKVLPFLESVEFARRKFQEDRENEEPDLEDVAAMLDPEKEQEIIDAEEEEEEDHPEYLHIDPEQVESESKEEETKKRKVFRTIEIPSNQVRLEQARQLDKMQKYVLSVGLGYAKGLVKARKGNSVPPSPPHMIVHGGAGSGKSCVIKPLSEWMQKILQQKGDNPENPYVVLTSFSGAAASNINGQTLHSMFGLKFGTKFVSLADQQRDATRCRFTNLKAVIIDEVSMVPADILYILDLKLREITQVNQPFGGVSFFLFGDLFQLRPTQAVHSFEEPKNREHRIVYQLRNLWQTFSVVTLEENHRQGDDKTYADLLNRVRTGDFTDEDMELLETRVRDRTDAEVTSQDDALHIYGTNEKVNARNKIKVLETEGELLEIKAENRHSMMKNFKPKVDKAGCVKNTSLQAVLQLKIGVQVMMTWNVDTVYGLTNGARGVLLGVEKEKMEDGRTKVKWLIIKFNNPNHGREQRERHPCHKFPEGTYVKAMWLQYNLGAAKAEVYQFPVRMAAAITAHKIQVHFRHIIFPKYTFSYFRVRQWQSPTPCLLTSRMPLQLGWRM
jgi:hypothetical protein